MIFFKYKIFTLKLYINYIFILKKLLGVRLFLYFNFIFKYQNLLSK